MPDPNFTEQSTSLKVLNHGGLLKAIIIATALGVFASLLFSDADVGLNATLWGITLLIGVLHFAGAKSQTFFARALLILALVFCLLFSWRDAPTLHALSVIALFSIAAVFSQSFWGFQLWDSAPIRFVSAHAVYGLSLIKNPFGAFRECGEHIEGVSPTQGKKILGVLRGLLLLAPLALLYLFLFASADMGYAAKLENLLDVDWDNFAQSVTLFAVFALLALGVFLGVMLRNEDDGLIQALVPREIGAVEANTILIGLNILFISFVLLQLQHLFGGVVYVGQTLNLSYADYAKNGFYQLLIATGCVIPLLLSLDWLCAVKEGKTRALFNANTCLLLLQVGVMLASAVHRLMLYVDAYGMSTQRVYGVAVLIWIAGLLLACGVLLLGKLRNRYAGVAWCWSIAIILCLHAVSPDALTMRINLDRAAAGKDFDMEYALTLNAEVVPGLLKRYPSIGQKLDSETYQKLRDAYLPNEMCDYRSWTYGKWQASRAIEDAYTAASD